MESADRFWTRRLRWRLLGAWRWPAFALFTAVDAVLLHTVGTGVRFNIPVSIILASFCNVALLAAADLLARLAERKRAERGIDDPHLPVAVDRGAVALLAVGAVGLAASGLATHHLIVADTNATLANAKAVQRWVFRYGTAENRRNIETANTARLGEGYFRTCIADDARRRYLCLFVDTKKKPPKVVRDPSVLPNRPAESGGGM
ncbi:MAG: hypothetical protein QOK25_1163 [Thermoleophilaceae bacterium]|nr:hypothetical protein [Thermoleophilaceae bacterium]